jgi:hypothetical protein
LAIGARPVKSGKSPRSFQAKPGEGGVKPHSYRAGTERFKEW